MNFGVRSLLVALVGASVLTLSLSAYAQDPTQSASSEVSTGSARTLDPAEAAARTASGKPLVDIEAIEHGAVVNPVANAQTAVGCNVCFTCGGDWPVFTGAIHAQNTGTLTTERGSACSGALHASNDSNPFVCCR